MLWALSLATTNLNRAYYGTDIRAYQLLAGALLALAPGLIRRAGRQRILRHATPVLAISALLVLSTSAIDMNPIHRGIAATITTISLIIAIETSRKGPINRVLSSTPLVYLGKISYGTYLWHWPVILFAVMVTDEKITPISTFAISALVATGLASLSYTLLERPIREHGFLDRKGPAVLVVGMSIGVIAAFVIAPKILHPYDSRHITAEGAE